MNRPAKNRDTTYDYEIVELRNRFLHLMDVLKPPRNIQYMANEMAISPGSLHGFIKQNKRTTPRLIFAIKQWILEKEQQEGIKVR